MLQNPFQEAIRAKCFHPSGDFEEFRKADVEQSIPDRLEQIVDKYPDRIALKTRSHTLTYGELDRAANRAANALLNTPGRGDGPVALLFENGAPFVVASLAALKAGKIQAALESSFPPARLRYMLEQSQASVLVTNDANLPLARELTDLPLLNIDQLGNRFSGDSPRPHVPPDAIAAIAYTSGSTGQPKGIIWNHRGLLHAVMRHTNTYHICIEDRLVMFRTSLRAYLYALLNGAAYFPVHLRQEEPTRLAEWMINEKITVYRAAVSAFRSFAGAAPGAGTFPHLRLILLFGEPVYHTDVALYRQHFADHTILAGSLGCMEFDDYACCFVDSQTPLTAGVLPGGYPLADTDILLLDDNGRPVGRDQVGEIAVRSPYNTLGYWRRSDLTQAAFLRDTESERIYRTGDLGRMRPDGCLFHLGRKDYQVKIRGHRVEVAEIEAALLDIAGVKEAAVVGWEDTPGNKRLVAYIVPAGADLPSVNELRRGLGEKLPDYMVPFTFITLAAMPLTATGKVDRRALPAPDGTRPALEASFAAPRTATEERLAAIWSQMLALDRVGVHDNFLELGGDSLSATQIISRVLSEFKVRLPLRLLLEAPTVAEMAEVIGRSKDPKEAGTRPDA